MNKIKSVVFDWNGTLVDDVWLSVNAMNAMLEKRGKKPITTEYYKEIFTFPVIDYYRTLGLDVENEWEEISREFMDIYLNNVSKVKLFRDVEPVVKHLREKGIKSAIFSAMEHSILNRHVKYLKIDQYFDFIQGIEDHYAGGKAHLGREIIKRTTLSGEEVLFAGDTYHDYEVAQEMGCKVVLISRGHNPYEQLKSAGVPVLNSLEKLKDLLDSQEI
jgi:phosphoglycolate phosphatase